MSDLIKRVEACSRAAPLVLTARTISESVELTPLQKLTVLDRILKSASDVECSASQLATIAEARAQAYKEYLEFEAETPLDDIMLATSPPEVLWQIAKRLASLCDQHADGTDDSIAKGTYRARILEEWTALYHHGIVKVKPPIMVYPYKSR
jgi:hypothetical protein